MRRRAGSMPHYRAVVPVSSPKVFSLRGSRSIGLLTLIIGLLAAPLLAVSGMTTTSALANQGTPAPLSCEPAPAQPRDAAAISTAAPAEPAGELRPITMGYVPVSIFAPVFVAKEKGYYAEQGLDVTLEPLPGGSDMVVLTASGEFDLGIGGVGPAFWNAMEQGLPLKVIAPGHAEGNPVATPLMISKAACESGEITKVADLAGKSVSVNARGATEYWLNAALGTGGLTIDDIDLQTLAFPDAVAALQSGAIDAAMIGEPLATQAEQQGIAVRLLTDFPVQDVQPTVIYANQNFIDDNPEAVQGMVTAYLKASRDLAGEGFYAPEHLAIIEQYTNVPADLIAAAVQPVFSVNGDINVDGLNKLQDFFRARDQLEYDENLDPNAFIDRRFVDAAVAALGPADD